MKGGRAAMIGLACAVPLAAHAAALPIIGNYGNGLGCELALTGNYNPVEGVQLLTPNDLSTAVTLCSFDMVQTEPGDRHHVKMTCASEGSGPEDNTKEEAVISGSAEKGYVVDFSDGSSWGPLSKCR
jgi:hypothetical protein